MARERKVGLVVFGCKAWDAVSAPLMGCISDLTRSKRGRRRLYFLVGIAPVFASFALLWIGVRTGNAALDFLYYFFAYMLFATVSTMVMISYSTLTRTSSWSASSSASSTRCPGYSFTAARGSCPSGS